MERFTICERGGVTIVERSHDRGEVTIVERHDFDCFAITPNGCLFTVIITRGDLFDMRAQHIPRSRSRSWKSIGISFAAEEKGTILP